jgi:hypothetical protein
MTQTASTGSRTLLWGVLDSIRQLIAYIAKLIDEL